MGLLLLIFWLIPIIALATVGRIIFPRYILFTTPYFLLSLAYLIQWGLLQKPIIKATTAIVMLGVIIIPVLFDFLLIRSPEKAPLPDTDYRQFVSDHPSGYGLLKIFDFLDNQSRVRRIILVTQGTFGLYPYAFNLQYWDNPRVVIIPKWPLDKIDEEIKGAQHMGEMYILLKEYNDIPANLPLELVLRSEKPGGRYPILLTRLKKGI